MDEFLSKIYRLLSNPDIFHDGKYLGTTKIETTRSKLWEEDKENFNKLAREWTEKYASIKI